MMGWLASIAARAVGPMIPWLLLGWVSSLGAIAMWQHHAGAVSERLVWQAKEDKLTAGAAKALADEIKKAAATGLNIAGVLRDAAVAIGATHERTRVIVREVSHAVDADPGLRVRMPDDVVRLRREQSDESARIAAIARHAAGKRP